MKNTFILTLSLFMILSSSYLFGQNPNPENRKEQYEAQKVAFISKKVNFTVKEAQLFWPHYNELQQKRAELQKSKRKILQKIMLEKDEISDTELEKLSDELIQLRLKAVQAETTYHEKFKRVLPIKKVLRYYQSEEQFKTYFVRQIRNNNRPKPNQGSR